MFSMKNHQDFNLHYKCHSHECQVELSITRAFPGTEYFNLWNVSLRVQSGHTQVQLLAKWRKLVSTEQFAETWLLLFSDCYQRPKLADHGHVPPLCGSFHAGTKPGRQEEKTRD